MGAAAFTVLIAAASHDAAAQDTQCGDTALKEFEKQIKQAELAIPKNPMGRWVDVGECTKRAVQRGITMASPKTNADAVDAENKVDCLRLAKFERTRACACAKIGVPHVGDDQPLEKSIRDVYKRITTLERRLQRVAIREKAVRDQISRANKIRDCVHTEVLSALQKIEKDLSEVKIEP